MTSQDFGLAAFLVATFIFVIVIILAIVNDTINMSPYKKIAKHRKRMNIFYIALIIALCIVQFATTRVLFGIISLIYVILLYVIAFDKTINLSNKNKTHNNNADINQSKTKIVEQIDPMTNKVIARFPSYAAASRATGAPASGISSACSNEYFNSYHGYKWRLAKNSR